MAVPVAAQHVRMLVHLEDNFMVIGNDNIILNVKKVYVIYVVEWDMRER